MRVICISEDNSMESWNNARKQVVKPHITLGEVYNVLNYGDQVIYYLIIDDRGIKNMYNMRLFKRLDDHRQEKLKEIGI